MSNDINPEMEAGTRALLDECFGPSVAERYSAALRELAGPPLPEAVVDWLAGKNLPPEPEDDDPFGWDTDDEDDDVVDYPEGDA